LFDIHELFGRGTNAIVTKGTSEAMHIARTLARDLPGGRKAHHKIVIYYINLYNPLSSYFAIFVDRWAMMNKIVEVMN